MSCEGCKEEAIRNRNQKQMTENEARKYADEKQVGTVVYFDGTKFRFCEEKNAAGLIDITAVFAPQH